MKFLKQYALPAFITIILALIITFGSLFYAYYHLPLGALDTQNDTVGASITTINGSDTLSSSRSVINTNFANLNSSKMEAATTSVSSITSLPNLSTIGTIVSGIWNGSIIPALYGGTGQSYITPNKILLGNGSGALATTTGGTDGQLLTYSSSSKPYWSSPSIDVNIPYTWGGSHIFNASTTFNSSTTLNNGFVPLTSPTKAGQIIGLNSSSTVPSGIYGTGNRASTSVKALDTVYQNTSGYPMVVTVSVQYSCQNTAGQYAYIDSYIGTTSPPTMQVGRTGLVTYGATSPTYSSTITLIVPNNYYYKFVSNVAGFSALSITYSIEYTLL